MHIARFVRTLLKITVILTLTHGAEISTSSKYADVDLGEVVQYRDGDILLAVFIPVTNHDETTGKCNNDFKYIHMVEQVNMMVEKVNADENILRGLKLGTIIINTCFASKHSLKKLVLDVLKTYLFGYHCTQDFCSAGKRILAGVVGATRSDVSMDMAKVLQIFKVSQVSYWATIQELSDKTMYEYFFRTVPSDVNQTLAMTKLITKMKWNYISIVYDDNAYGLLGYAELSIQLKLAGICVAVALPYREATSDVEAVAMVKLLLANKRSRAAVLFSHLSVVGKLLSAAERVRGGTDLIWIASDAWAAITPLKANDSSYIQSLHGTLGTSLKFSSADVVNERIRGLTIQDYRGENATLNPWWVEYVKHVKNCTLYERDFGKRLCAKNESISDFSGVRNGIDDSIKVFVHAIDAYQRNICNNKSGLCDELAKTAGTNVAAHDLYEYVKNVSFTSHGKNEQQPKVDRSKVDRSKVDRSKLDRSNPKPFANSLNYRLLIVNDGRTFEFDRNQDGPPVYDIYAFDKDDVTSQSVLDGWKQVGIYEKREVYWNSSLPNKTSDTKSNCSDPCGPGHATIAGDQMCCWFCEKCENREYVGDGVCENCSDEEKPNDNQTSCVPIEIGEMHYSSGYAIGSITVGMFGVICTILITIMYIKNKDTAIVRASGRELCFFVLMGVFITLLNCFTIAAKPSAFTCGTTRVILAIGPSFMYAGLLMKTFRVVFIFQSKGILSVRTKAYLEPVPLLFVTLCVVAVQVVVLLVWMLIHPPDEKVNYFHENNTAFRSCKHLLDVEIFVGFAYPFLIIIICTILATINRNVPTGFRETLFVGFTMYTTCVTWIAFLPLFFTFPTDIPRQLTTLSISLSVSALTVLFCLFGPRCYTMLRHPEQNTAEAVMSKNGSNYTGHPRALPKIFSLNGVVNLACSANGKSSD